LPMLPEHLRATKENPSVLIVDDDPTVRKVIAAFLGSDGFNTLEAQNGLEAVQVFGSSRRSIALVITDLEMPVMDGLEAVARMKAIDQSVRVLMISGHPAKLEQDRYDCKRLAKPFSRTQLLDSVHLALAA
jgi:CheY-like chemotaxis protein